MEIVKPPGTVHPDRAIVWDAGVLLLLDQRVLPDQEQYIALRDAHQAADAIRQMVVRGAPAIGITAAYATVLSARNHAHLAPEPAITAIRADMQILAGARPTAVNLFWALERMGRLLDVPTDGNLVELLTVEARRIHDEDITANHQMGAFGASLIHGAAAVITHCNAGGLATGGHGTALGVIRSAFAQGKISQVYADETRPWLQGARLTAWELAREGIPVSVMVDGAAAARMAQGGIQWVIVGSDRIAANGDVANKIGTYGLAVLARQHGVKFMVAAPTSTVDLRMASGSDIPIEERDPEEVLSCGSQRTGAPGAGAWNPVFDVTPARLVDAIVTEKGIVTEPDATKMRAHMAEAR
ncbi:MAG: S-methyl-5-thioribose-1-phosphate isomerase [Pseudomonadota bacterium]